MKLPDEYGIWISKSSSQFLSSIINNKPFVGVLGTRYFWSTHYYDTVIDYGRARGKDNALEQAKQSIDDHINNTHYYRYTP